MKGFANQTHFNDRRIAAALNRYNSLPKTTKAKIIKKSFKKNSFKKQIKKTSLKTMRV